ncbi:MAG TPA: hypothetical protein VEZ51_08305, partial [Gemmatimonadaceae bacterium]|nr:hypothetical protein [Gemmatimonadaceae bacterium]
AHPSLRLGLKTREAWTFVALAIALVVFGVAPRALVDSRFAASDDILRQRQEARPIAFSRPLVDYRINLAAVQLARYDPAAAETLAREGLRIRALAPGLVPSRRRTFIEDDWSVGGTKSLLGAAPAARGRFAEAESVLLDALRDLKAMPSPPRRDITDTVVRVIQLYEAWGLPERAAAYRASLRG